MSEKGTTHTFETNDAKIEITEYPFYPGDELHIDVVPQHIESVSLMGNPEGEQTLFIRNEEFMIWVKGNGLVNLIREAVEKYDESWSRVYDSSEQSITEEPQ